jgi:sortase (surface protein transpeptidase)
MTERSIPPKRHPFHPWADKLVVAGIGLVAAGVTAFTAAGQASPQLDVRAQDQRVLPAPAMQVARRIAPPTRKPAPQHARQEPRPVRIVIPAIGVSAPVIPLGLNRDGSMQVPASFTETGWFRPGPEPGELGAAVIAGHVDSYRGPGVFFHLRALQRGDRIRVVLATGRKLRFVVTGSREVLKKSFPSKLVFGGTPKPTLRLITCGGRFDSSTGHYVGNHIVFARLAGRQ